MVGVVVPVVLVVLVVLVVPIAIRMIVPKDLRSFLNFVNLCGGQLITKLRNSLSFSKLFILPESRVIGN